MNTISARPASGELPKALRHARLRSGLSIVEAAARLEVSVMRYHQLESGEASFDQDHQWADALIEIGKPRKAEERS